MAPEQPPQAGRSFEASRLKRKISRRSAREAGQMFGEKLGAWFGGVIVCGRSYPTRGQFKQNRIPAAIPRCSQSNAGGGNHGGSGQHDAPVARVQVPEGFPGAHEISTHVRRTYEPKSARCQAAAFLTSISPSVRICSRSWSKSCSQRAASTSYSSSKASRS